MDQPELLNSSGYIRLTNTGSNNALPLKSANINDKVNQLQHQYSFKNQFSCGFKTHVFVILLSIVLHLL